MSEVRKFLEEILTIEQNYEELVAEINEALRQVYHKPSFGGRHSPREAVRELRDLAMKGGTNV